MTVAQLIEMLQNVLENYGDVEVLIPNIYDCDYGSFQDDPYYSFEGKIYLR